MAKNAIWTGAASSVYDLDDNWGDGGASAKPAAADTVYFNEQSTRSVAGSDESGTSLAGFHVNMDCTFEIGTNGTPLQITSPLVYIGEPSLSPVAGPGSGRINLAPLGAAAIYVYNSASSSTDTGKEPIRLKPNNSGTTITVDGGLVGIATDSIGDTATVGQINVTGGTCHIASGVTLTTLDISSGQADLYAAATTVSISGGVLNTRGDFSIGTLNIFGGTATVAHRKAAAGAEVTTLNLYNATIDLSDSPDTFLIGTLNYWGNCRIIANAANRAHVSWTTMGTQAGTLTLDAA